VILSVRYSVHAEQKMVERGISKGDVEQIIANPTRGTYEPPERDRREHFGHAADGSAIDVLTNRVKTVVITVIQHKGGQV
jgi:hypothetical protein